MIQSKSREKWRNILKVYIGNYKGDKPQKTKIKIHDYDTFSLDVTLASIIYPSLIKLKENLHGAPITHNEDVPEELYLEDITNAMPYKEENSDLFFSRWDYILGEMIYAFEQIQDKFDLDFQAYEKGLDYEKARQDRIQNGLNLFAKYYLNLWT